MTDPPPPAELPAGVAVSLTGDGFAYVPGRLIVRGDEARRRVNQLIEVDGGFARPGERLIETDETWWRMPDVPDPISAVEILRGDGFVAQLEHVFFAHACGCFAPTWGNPCGCDPWAPFGPDPLRANPLRANPLRANPLRANPLRANPLRANHPMDNTARPADGPELVTHAQVLAQATADQQAEGGKEPVTGPAVVVLDTGVATHDGVSAWSQPWKAAPLFTGAITRRVTGAREVPDVLPDPRGDRSLDPVAGHGTFIAGLIEQLAPGCSIRVDSVISPNGVVNEGDVCQELDRIARDGGTDLLSLSFGGQLMGGTSPCLRSSLARVQRSGAVVVASAGNDGTCVPQFPAAAPGVLAVGAVDTCGPAYFTNHGDWVDACAPGVDLVSAFFDGFNGQHPAVNGVDLDHFRGWARWSGTSFAAPVVVGVIAREMLARGGSAADAVQRVIRAPHLLRWPGLGTVVNV